VSTPVSTDQGYHLRLALEASSEKNRVKTAFWGDIAIGSLVSGKGLSRSSECDRLQGKHGGLMKRR
jgi:hypothetical protein